MENLEQHLDSLDPELARRIRDSASRAGLQTHDPAARMIAEMWVAVAALKQERNQLSREMAGLARRVRVNHRNLLALLALGVVNLVALLALLALLRA